METTLLKTCASLQLLPALLAGRWWLVALIFFAVALFGRRVYCRFVCPLGIAQSLVRGFVGKRRICSRLDGVSVRRPWFAVRLVILVAAVVVGVAGLGWQWLDPYAIASRAACWFATPEFDLAVAVFALVPAAVILLLAIFFSGRIWCNWVCPVGTVLALVGIRPWKGDKVKVKNGEKGEKGEKGERGVKVSGCGACRRCFK